MSTRSPRRSMEENACTRFSATYSSGIRSTFRCRASTARRVAADRANASPQVASHGRSIQPIQKKADAVHAGEDEPVVRSQSRDGAVERTRIGAAAESRLPGTRSRRRRARAAFRNSAACSRARVTMILRPNSGRLRTSSASVQRHDFADDHSRGRLKIRVPRSDRQWSRESRPTVCWSGRVPQRTPSPASRRSGLFMIRS